MTSPFALADDLDDLPSSGSGTRVAAELDTVASDEDLEEHVRPLDDSAHETLSDWFGDDDATTVSFHGELRHKVDAQPELFVHGQPLSESLDNESQVYFYEVFVPSLLREGRASWRGTESRDGGAHDGCVAELTPDGSDVILTYGARAEEMPSAETPTTDLEVLSAAEPVPDARETTTLNLDELL